MSFQRRITSALLVAALFVAVGSSHADEGADTLRIATYNLRNYLVMDRHVGAVWRPSYPKPESEKAIVREVIASISPDILLVQEIGTVPFLEELRADLALADVHYPYAIHMEGKDDVRHVAVLSKIAPVEVVKHDDLNFKYLERRELVKRGMLEVSFRLADGTIFRVFNVHLKSRYTEDKEDPNAQRRRTREAEACRNRMIERTRDSGVPHYLVGGDFNEHPNGAPMRRFYRRGDFKIGSLVPAADARGEVWTYFFEKQATYWQVDGFVVSPTLLPRVLTGRGRIADLPGILTGSDHRPVFIDLDNREGTAR